MPVPGELLNVQDEKDAKFPVLLPSGRAGRGRGAAHGQSQWRSAPGSSPVPSLLSSMEKLLHLTLVFLSGKKRTWLWGSGKGRRIGAKLGLYVKAPSSEFSLFPFFTKGPVVIPVLPDFLTGILLSRNRKQ